MKEQQTLHPLLIQKEIAARVNYRRSVRQKQQQCVRFKSPLSYAGMQASSGHVGPFVGHPLHRTKHRNWGDMFNSHYAPCFVNKMDKQKERGPRVRSHDSTPRETATSVEKKNINPEYFTLRTQPRPHFRLQFRQALSICNNLWTWMGNIIDYKWKKNNYIHHKTALCLIIKSGQRA